MYLTLNAGWNQTERDWHIFLKASPKGCFVAVDCERVVGTVTTIRYGEQTAWIGMLLVDAGYQRRGIGRALMQRALEHLANCSYVKLDATPLGRGLYESLGFQTEDTISRFTHDCAPDCFDAIDPSPKIVDRKDFAKLLELDEIVFGSPRFEVLTNLVTSFPKNALGTEAAGNLCAFSLTRGGRSYHQIGPVVARNFAEAQGVTGAAFRQLKGLPCVLDVPTSRSSYSEWLNGLGFVAQRSFARMSRQPAAPELISPMQYAICGPEFG
jgi:GNAT superfamily N-acetyltransferase